MSLIIDASVAIKWYVAERDSPEARRLLDRADELAAPDLLIAETVSIVWRLARTRHLTEAQATGIANAMPNILASFVPSGELASTACAMAHALDHSPYDCFYLALADMRDSTMVTADRRFHDLVKASRWHRRIALLGARAH